MSFPRYPAYKYSGVEWLGEVPEHWEVHPFKWEIERNDGGVWGDEPEDLDDTIVLRSTEQTIDGKWRLDDPAFRKLSHTERSSTLLEEDDLVVTKSSGSATHIGKTTLVSAELATLGCCFSNFMQRIRLRPSFHPRLAWYAMNNEIIRKQFDYLSNKTTGLANLNATMIGMAIVPVPTFGEQEQIVTFLDREAANIDALIAKQHRLIELLQEKRQAVISHAVTKGLNPNAPMKDSGVEWLGEVPEHWEVKPLKHLANIQTGMAKGKDVDDVETREVPFLRVANVQDGYLELDDVHVITVPASAVERYLLRKGDVLMNEGGDFDKLGRGCLWNGEIDQCIHQNHVFAVRPHSVSGDWLNTYTTSKSANSYFISRSKQSTNLASISSSNLMGLVVPIPPISEAESILCRLGLMLKELDDLREASAKATSLLQERRSALISAAVTGQIDVRGLVPEAVEQ